MRFYILLIISILFHPYNFKGYTPPGTVKIKGQSFYVDQREVTNAAWAEYLYSLKKRFGEDSEGYKNALPDSVVWHSAYSGKLRFSSSYADYPVVGVSAKQALKYCQWRSSQVDTVFPAYKTTYTLPSHRQWKIIVSSQKVKRPNPANILYSEKVKGKAIYGIYDNVSEYIDSSGYAVGHSWKSINANSNKDTILKVDHPAKWLGFRCVATYH